MTSWLDTKKYMTSLAKNAIAEAKSTLDKALDIEEDEQNPGDSQNSVIVSNVTPGLDQWGSFTGSFFSIPPDKKSIRLNSQGEFDSLFEVKFTLKMLYKSVLKYFKLITLFVFVYMLQMISRLLFHTLSQSQCHFNRLRLQICYYKP